MRRITSFTSIPFRKGLSSDYTIIFLLVLILIFNTSCRNQSNNKKDQAYVTFTDGYGFSFDLPEFCEAFSMEDLVRIREINPTIAFMAVTGMPFVGQQSAFLFMIYTKKHC